MSVDMWARFAAIVGGTFVSEDATCIATGLLIRARQLHWTVGLAACTLGIFLGDLGLWLIGRAFGRRALAWNRVRRRLPADRVEQLGDWFDRRGWTAVLAARFVPGTRFPVYVAAGTLGRRVDRFLLWALLAALLWTPLLVLLVAALGKAIAAPFEHFVGVGWRSYAVALGVLLLVIRLLPLCVTNAGRARLRVGVSRIWRWEFWPAWLFYVPLLPWLAYLAVRHRGLTTPTAANPAIRHGGVVGESKYDILSRLPPAWIVPSALIPARPSAQRMDFLRCVMAERGWTLPLVLKPDAGQRGAGVKLVRDASAAERYLAQNPLPALAQAYHAGPFEAGVFYYRLPGDRQGRIFSITDKTFPVIVGDGASTVESLIRRHPRFRMQAGTFLARMNGQARTILACDERLQLAIAGNHCQGTMFRDGAHLITPELECTIDQIAREFGGFCFGRFDVRYSDVEAFKAGRDFAIVELNGVTSESTNLYDPSWSLLSAYRVLFRQWSLLFEIGSRNRSRGHPVSPLWQVAREAWAFYRSPRANPISD